MYIDFESIMSLNGCDLEEKYGNHKCPFCHHFSFKIYPNARAYCHTNTCNWTGDAIQFHADINKITNLEAFTILIKELKKKTIKIKNLTFDEAFDDVAEKLQFMATARAYFAFYRNERVAKAAFQKATGLSKAHFSKIINGDIDKASAWIFNSVYFYLRRYLNFDQLKLDMNSLDFQKTIVKESNMLHHVNKFMKGML